MTGTDDNGERTVTVRGCLFPTYLFYDVENHIWYEPLFDGTIRVGMTCVGSALASYRIFAVTPRRVGRDFEAKTSIATIESSKWVGPARVAFDGTIITVNDDISLSPGLLADDPYDKGWLVVVRPRANDALARLVTGAAVEGAYLRWMNDNDFPGCGEPSS